MSKTLCPLPWIHVSQRNNGHFRVCCHSNTNINKGLLSNTSNNYLHASTATLNDVRNSSTLKEMRQLMKSGQWHPQCGQCQREEASGLRSPRINELERWEKTWDSTRALLNTHTDGSLNLSQHPLLSADIRLGNVCNLKCRMCGPMDSRAWYADYQKLYGIKHFKDTHGTVVFTDQNKNDAYMWYEDNHFWNQLFLQKESLRSLYLVGGEPLLIQKHFEFLTQLVEARVSHNIELVYNTNLTVLTNEIIELWEKFRVVNVGVSLDGIFLANDYIRASSAFSIIHKNIRKLDSTGGNIHIWLAPTLQIYNILNIPDLLQWLAEEDFHFLQTPTQSGMVLFHPLHNPQFLNVQTLPLEAKNKINQHYERFFKEFLLSSTNVPRESILKTVAYLQQFLNYMMANDSSHLMKQFVQHTERLDVLRDEKFAESLPQLHIMLQEYFSLHTHSDQIPL